MRRRRTGRRQDGSDKPKGAPGTNGLKWPSEQRTRRWSKASRSRFHRGTRRETAGGCEESKDEGARFAVNGAIGDDREPVTRAHADTEIRLRACVAVGGGKASKGSRCIAGSPSRNGTKRGEPQDRQRPENGRRVVEEQTVEVVRNHEDGSRMRMAFSSRRADEAGR